MYSTKNTWNEILEPLNHIVNSSLGQIKKDMEKIEYKIDINLFLPAMRRIEHISKVNPKSVKRQNIDSLYFLNYLKSNNYDMLRPIYKDNYKANKQEEAKVIF